MKKRIIAILAVGALLLSLFGCSATGMHKTVPRGVTRLDPVPSVTPGQYAPTEPKNDTTRNRVVPRNRTSTEWGRNGYTGRGYRDGFTRRDARNTRDYNRFNVKGGLSKKNKTSPRTRTAPRTSPRTTPRPKRTAPSLPRARRLPAAAN